MAYRGYYGSYNTPAGSFISGFTEGGRPFLNQIIEERRRKKRKEERSQFITQNLMALDPSIDPARAEAFANLGGAGVNLPFSQLQPEAPPDLSQLITDPQDAPYLEAVKRGDITPEFALRTVQGKQALRAQAKADEKQFKALQPLFDKFGLDTEKLRAAEFASKFLTKETVSNILFPSKTDVETEADQIVTLTKGKSYEDLTVQDKLKLTDLGISDAELIAAYGISDEDTGPAEVVKLKRSALKKYIEGRALFSSIEGTGIEGIVASIEEAVRILEQGGLPQNLTPIFDQARVGMGDKSKKEMRDILKVANDSFNWDLSDNEIELILLELYKRR